MTRIILLLTTIILTSCSDTINTDENLLENIVVMEDQVQRMNSIQLDRGSGFMADVKSELAATQRNDEMKLKTARLTYVLNMMDIIDHEATAMITWIEQCKLELLEKAGENVKEDATKNPASIVWRKHDPTEDGNRPSRLNLSAIKDKGNTTVAAAYFVSADGISPSAEGLELWNAFNQFRKDIVQLTGTYGWHDKDYSVDPIDIITYKNNEDLLRQVRDMINNSNCKHNEDTQVLIDLYMGLTKAEKIKYSDETVHWISATFKHSPLVNAIATLSSLEQDILSARALALANWKSKVSTCSYSFNSIIPLAIGPSVCHEGEEIEIQVMMAAFDSDNQPVVTSAVANSSIHYNGNGNGVVRFKPTSGLNNYKGTVSIKNMAGLTETKNWEWTVNVLPE